MGVAVGEAMRVARGVARGMDMARGFGGHYKGGNEFMCVQNRWEKSHQTGGKIRGLVGGLVPV